MRFYFRALSKDLKLAEMIALKLNAIFDELLATTVLGLEANVSKLCIEKKERDFTAAKTFLTAIERSDDAQKIDL